MPNSAVDVQAGAPNPESYTDNGDGTVTDNVTGLVWQQTTAPTMLSWQDALSYCANLTLGGRDDWRLPRLIELVSIADYTTLPTIAAAVFPNTPMSFFWTANPHGMATPPAAWNVCFFCGQTNTNSASSPNSVRCVR